MTRRLMVAAVALAAMLITPAAAIASTPYSYHTLVDRTATSSFNTQRGDLVTAVWVTTTAQHMALKPGEAPSISRGALTSVEILVQDTSKPMGKGYLTVAEWFGQVQATGSFRNHLDAAAVQLTIPVTDQVSGDSGIARVAVSWTATARAEGRPWHVHVRYPGYVTINSNANEWMRPAVALGSVTLDGAVIVSGATDNQAMLASTKFNCRQVGFRVSIDWGECL